MMNMRIPILQVQIFKNIETTDGVKKLNKFLKEHNVLNVTTEKSKEEFGVMAVVVYKIGDNVENIENEMSHGVPMNDADTKKA